jgi:type III secretion system (T3SS) SseB-like protein
VSPSEPPPMVYIPCTEHVAKPEEAEPVAVFTQAGRLVLMVYSATDKLYAQWGDGHPWLALPAAALGALQESHAIDQIALDADSSGDLPG